MSEVDLDIDEEHDLIVDDGDKVTHDFMFPNCKEVHDWDDDEDN